MLPENSGVLSSGISLKSEPIGLTYKIQNGKIVGMCEGKEALMQTIEHILKTERFGYGIYSWNYGNELLSLMGLSDELAKARAKTKVSDALLTDNRIISIGEFDIKISDRSLYLNFEVNTIYGDINYTDSII